MSASRKMVLINDLKPFKEEWRIRLKLLHTWKTKTDYGGESLECIFADETGQKIHASCKRTLMYRVQRDIQLGEWRELENFKISAAGGQYRPSKFQYKLTVIGDTKIKPTDYRDENQFLSLASYEEIVTGKLNTFFLIDVMGQVVDLGEVGICQLKTGENRKRVNFRLRDTRMSQTDLPLALLGSSDENKVIKQVVDDWNEVDIKCISEIYLAVEISKEISYKENDNTGLKQQSLSGNQTIDQRNIQPSVAICSVFKRIFDDLDLRPISKYNYVREGQNISTPKTPTCKRRCVLAKDKSSAENKTLHKCLQRRKKIPVLRDITNFSETHFSEVDNAQEAKDQRSTETNTTHVPNKRKQRQNKISVGYDIPNIDQLHDDHIEDDPEEMNDCDVDIEGIIEEIDADLEFDVSSQETTDSENDDLGLDVSNANITYPFRQEVKRKTKPLRKSSICKSRARVA
ncbi:hypothetical protein Bca52824_081756 [Brassica carinata]|uniref:Replication protein A 70 kDa DNA-binding subunit B/D first OB fold domain-containing protein n=1 Tax=Brassica carinata TaxID=52824 RepID=A0A8X7PHX2_BRACI|nr:hypothetical protein Bca52824_081756 [Brassica carinata]